MRSVQTSTRFSSKWLTLWVKLCARNYSLPRRIAICALLAIVSLLIYLALTFHGSSHFPISKAKDDQSIGKENPQGDHVAIHFSPKDMATTAFEQWYNEQFSTSSGILPLKCNNSVPHSELFTWPPIHFLPNFKNPCWREPMPSSIEKLYENNTFYKHLNLYDKLFKWVMSKWYQKEDMPTERIRCLPYFFLAGQPKCGSTDLYQKILSHPEVELPPTKESHWWAKQRYGAYLNFTRNIPFSDYIDLFDKSAYVIDEMSESNGPDESAYHRSITGDASVSMLWFNDHWWRSPENCGTIEPRYTNAHYLHRIIPQARIVVILRNPVDRLYSDFLYFQYKGKTQQHFHSEVVRAIEALTTCVDALGMRACVYNRKLAGKSRVRLRIGLYQVFLAEWLSVFPRDQVCVVRLEDYSLRPVSILRKVQAFLGLTILSKEEDMEALDQPVANVRRPSDRELGGMLPETRTLLENFYRPYNKKLAKLMGDNGFLWEDR